MFMHPVSCYYEIQKADSIKLGKLQAYKTTPLIDDKPRF